MTVTAHGPPRLSGSMAEPDSYLARMIFGPRDAAAVAPAPAQLDTHLAAAIKQFSSSPIKAEPTMRGMQRLATLTTTLVEQMDKEADAAADEVQQAHDYARAAIGKFRDQGKQIRQSADDMLAQLGQITNG